MIDNYSVAVDLDLRNGVPLVPFEILKQKYLLYKAIHLIYLGRKEQALEKLLKSINTGTLFDAKVRKECLQQVVDLTKLNIAVHLKTSIQAELDKFRLFTREFIFLVDV